MSCAPWPPSHPPFVELRGGLRDVERFLNGDSAVVHRGWRRLDKVLGSEARASDVVSEMLELAKVRWHLDSSGTGWRLAVTSSLLDDRQLAALIALARLVEADGWRRVKRCAAAGCERAFPDITNGCSAAWCSVHRRRRGPKAGQL